jgi:hypothetical protein
MTEEKLRQLKEDGYSPACVVESSPGSFQAVLTIPKCGDDSDAYDREAYDRNAYDREAANGLTRELNACYGDPKLSGAIHAHRLPPFANYKPKHRKGDGTYPATRLAEADGGICLKASERLKEIQKRLAEEALLWRERTEQRGQGQGQEKSGRAYADDSNGAYRLHWRDVLDKTQGEADYSRIDAMAALRMRVTGYGAGQICAAIQNNAPAMRKEVMSESEYGEKYRYRNWERYAKETAERYVFGPRGAAQYAKAEGYRAYYLKLEAGQLAYRNSAEGERNQKDGLSR